jgi:hypothetical protein
MPTPTRDGLDGALDAIIGAANREARYNGDEAAFDELAPMRSSTRLRSGFCNAAD